VPQAVEMIRMFINIALFERDRRHHFLQKK
jgi:hypothetical protein